MGTRKRKGASTDKVAALGHAIKHDVDHAAKAVTTTLKTVGWDDVPTWLQDNKYIRTGYRAPNPSVWSVLESLTFMHNETCNIYTHLLGALLLPALAWSCMSTLAGLETATVTAADYAVVTLFFVGAEVCLVFSALFHLSNCYSPAAEQFWLSMDLLGIVVVTVASFIPGIYYLFACEPGLQVLHWSIVRSSAAELTQIGASGLCTASFIAIPHFRTLKWRRLRASAYTALGMSGFVPLLHGLWRYGLPYMLHDGSLGYYLLELAAYGVGVGLYGSRTPERFAPGVFDLWGSSHQIFHLAVLCGMYFHAMALQKSLDAAHRSDVCRVKGITRAPASVYPSGM